MNLSNFELVLQNNDFDTTVADGVLAASREIPGYSVEITIDSGGECLVKKVTEEKQSSKMLSLANQKISKISFDTKVSQIRIKLVSSEDLLEILKVVTTPQF